MKKHSRAALFLLAAVFAKFPVFASDIAFSAGAGATVGGFFTRYWIDGDGTVMKIKATQNMNQFNYGLHAFLDVTFAELSVSWRNGVNSFEETADISTSVSSGSGRDTVLALCLLGKYPIRLGNTSTFFPMAGAEYQFCLRQQRHLVVDGSTYDYDRTDGTECDKDGNPYGLSDWNALWIHIGGGLDIALAANTYLRCVVLYSIRTMTSYEAKNLDFIKSLSGDPDPSKGGLASGPSLRVSLGYKL